MCIKLGPKTHTHVHNKAKSKSSGIKMMRAENRLHSYINAYKYICKYVHVSICVCVHARVCVCINVCECVYGPEKEEKQESKH